MQRRPAFVPHPDWELWNGEPRANLGTWPTPIHRMEQASGALGCEIWVKREDLCGAWGGNKVRKLEFWLAHAQVWKRRHIIVSGAGASTWAAAAALHARKLGLQVTAALAGPIPDDRRKLFADLGVDPVHRAGLNSLPLAVAEAKMRHPSALRLPMGGSGGVGDLGSLLAGSEIAHALARQEIPRFDRVYVAAGTSGTAAGIAAALVEERVPTVAVRVVPRPLGTRPVVMRHAKRLLRMRPGAGRSRPVVVGEDGFFGESYGGPGPGVDEAIELAAQDGIELERTYTAKAFAALVSRARAGAAGPLLFVHTASTSRPSG
jgi:1-aminocyclopropane-1-carboxylate deaminase/D-cysteine desulfhydrase-like pyridoxal-dependent ACC family enzyme